METALKLTSLHGAHVALKGRMVDFAGWDLPVMYGSILDEARAVRNDVGIFDISHMGRLRVSGQGAADLLQRVTSNDVAALEPSHAHYSLLTNPTGGIIDDIIVYREDQQSFLVILNASNADKDMAWIRSHAHSDAALEDRTLDTAMVAVQGPNAPQMVARLAGRPDLLDLNRFQYGTGQIDGVETTFCRTGYTGEDGFELIVPAVHAEEVWSALLRAGAVPCGLGARDALRIEAGYPLYGHEIDDATSPVEAGLMWVVKLDKGEFIGREAILMVKRSGPSRKLMGLVSDERIQPRQGYTITSQDDEIGVVTSGVFSPTRARSVAMAYIATPYARVGQRVSIAIRDKRSAATIVMKKSLLTDQTHRPDTAQPVG